MNIDKVNELINKNYIEIEEITNSLNNLKFDYLYIENYFEMLDNDFNINENVKLFLDLVSKNDILNNLTISDIEKTYKNLNKGNLIFSYIKYRKFKKSKLFSMVNENSNIDDIFLVSQKIKGLLNNEYALIPPLKVSKYTDEFIKSNVYNQNLSNTELLKICKYVNKKVNNYDTEIIYKTTFQKIIHWKKFKTLVDNKKIIIKKKVLLENEIFEEFKENIENIDIYKNSFLFLNLCIKNEFVHNIIKDCLDEKILKKNLNNIYNSLQAYLNYINVVNNVKNLSLLDLNLLDLIYDNFNDKNEALFLVNNLQNIYILKNAKQFKKENINKFSKINKIPKLINNLYKLKKYSKNNKYDLDYDYFKNNKNIKLNPNLKNLVNKLGFKIDFYRDSNVYIYENIFKFTKNKDEYLLVVNLKSSMDFKKYIPLIFELKSLNIKIQYIWLPDLYEENNENVDNFINLLKDNRNIK